MQTDTSSKLSDGFDVYFDALCTYRAQNGNLDIPLHYTTPGPDGNPLLLGMWVATAREAYALSMLPRCREEAFRTVPGWKWGQKVGNRKFDHRQAWMDYKSGMTVKEVALRHRVTPDSIQALIKKNEKANWIPSK